MRKQIYSIARKVYHEVHGIWFHKYKIDLGEEQKWSLLEKIKYNRLGFTNEDYADFNLKNADYHDYISFRERWRLEYLNGRFADILGEKLMFERIFGHYIGVPHINCWVKNHRCIDMETGSEIEILSILESKKSLIAKPTRSVGGGSGIHRIKNDCGEYWIDQRTVTAEELKEAVCKWEEYIIVDFVNQAMYSDEIYAETTNTIRVVTVQRKNGDFDVVLAFHRFGTDSSRPVDNICSGGVVALVDLNNGQLSVAKRVTEPNKSYSNHPDSGSLIEGVQIPKWNQLKQTLIHVHQCFPYYTFLAWDVVLDQNEKPIILEINRGCDLNVQVIRPLRKEKIGIFMQEYGLLDNR